MDSKSSHIEVYCDEEKSVVGHIDTTGYGGKITLDRIFLASNFVPMDNGHRLGALTDRKPIKCPHCYGHLVLKGTVKTDEHKDAIQTDGIIIIVGLTKLEIKS